MIRNKSGNEVERDVCGLQDQCERDSKDAVYQSKGEQNHTNENRDRSSMKSIDLHT